MTDEKERKQTKYFAIAIIAAVLIFILLILLLVVFRSAKNDDIVMKVNDDFSVNINILITPKNDINDLQLTFQFSDRYKKVLDTKNYILGNVKAGTTYSVTYKLSDFSLSQLTQIQYVTYDVTGGRIVKYHITRGVTVY